RFHVMSKPGGSACNLDCQYCFYLHKEDLLEQKREERMSFERLEHYIRDYIESQDGEQIVFSWQGGEPTLLGLDYYKKAVEFQKKYQPAGVTIENDLQTNGIMLNDQWCEFLSKNNFLVGLSIDGPREMHDKYRVSKNGKPTFDLVMKAVDRMKRHKVRFNALAVINNHNVKYPLEVYRFLTKELGATYVQFTPCVESKDFTTTAPQFWQESDLPVVGDPRCQPTHPESIVTDWSVDANDWGHFLKTVFEEWVNNDLGRVLVNLFETAVAQMMGKPSQLCVTAEFCGKGLAVEHDGSVYSCDHYVYPEYQLGHIDNDSLANLVFSERQKSFGLSKRDTLPKKCKECRYLKLCWGECPKNRLLKTESGEAGLNYLCPGIQDFFAYAAPMLMGIVTLIRQGKL
ncbi:anaerobic sulfatase maturase, partial [Endozoicomonas sp.]|uniref:anaerobic sulfatase maturase n=1 Tax=Endozoicomonas sp. TaxID=1892382 RepID=UPI00383AE624